MKRTRGNKLSTLETFEYRRLMGIIRRVRNRWRLKILMRGLGLLLLTVLATVVLAAWGLDAFRYRPWALGAGSVATYLALLFAGYRFIVRPLWRQVPDAQVALYIEEQATELDGSLLSAVEFGEPEGRDKLREISPQFVDKIVQQAVAAGGDIDYGKTVDKAELRRFSGFLGAASMAVVATVLINPAFLRLGAPRLFRPWGFGATESPYSISVLPGNGELARGGEQLVTAMLSGFDSEQAEISFKVGDGEWQRLAMLAGADGYTFMLFDVADDAEYFVEANGVKSEIYRLSVVDLPYVGRIDLQLDFPAYSGLSPQQIEDGGDVAALAGTRVRLTVVPTVQVPSGRIRIELPGKDLESLPATTEVDLVAVGESLEGEFTVESRGYYRIDLQGWDGGFVEASTEYVIEVLSDQPPIINFDRPGRDLSAAAVEEVFTELSARDDFGLGRVELIWSLNGGEDQTVVLHDGVASGRKQLTGAHTFYLDEYELQAGDLLTYYAQAADQRDAGGGQLVATDIYFVSIRPFQQDYRQADAGGGGGGGGDGGELSQQQRQIVAATFKISRDRDRLDRASVEEDLALLNTMQGQLRARTEEMATRASGGGGDAVRAFELLQAAAASMREAEAELAELDAKGALKPEQVALRVLQSLEALTRENTVAFNQGQGGGGGVDSERLAEMFDFDDEALDNQYESVQRDRQQQADNEVDAAMQRLTELARRQQQEIERQRAQAGGPAGQGSGDAQRQIAEEAEELARQLERLARSSSRRELQEAANELRQSVDAMRRAAASGAEGQDSEGARALSELQNARRLLDTNREGRLQRDLDDVQERIAEMRQAQEKIQADVERLSTPAGSSSERLENMLERKDELAAEINELEAKIDRMARGSRSEQLETSRGLQEAGEWIRDSKLADKVRYSKGVAQERNGSYARQFEEGISDDLERLEQMVDNAADGIQQSEEDRLASSLEQTRDLVERLESFEQRLQDAEAGDAAEGQRRLGEPGQQPADSAADGEREGAGGQQGRAGENGQGGEQGDEGQGNEGQGNEGQGNAPGGSPAGQPGGGQLGGSANGVPNPRQLRREFQERVQDAEQLREALREQGVQVTDLDDVIDRMSEFQEDFEGTSQGIAELRSDVIDGLKLFEFWLRRVTDAASGLRPQLNGSAEVPEEYRALVQEYFRALAGQSTALAGQQR